MVADQKRSSDSALSGQIRALERKMEAYHSQHKKLKKEVNRLEKHVDWLQDDVDELLAMGHCNCSKESVNSSSESGEETITIMEESEESDSDYTPCKASIDLEKKVRKVKCVREKSSNKKAKPRRNPTRAVRSN
jgi:predicted nuclease with TOPRIM domain